MSLDEPIAIRGIAAGGDGVGTLADGRTVFVPRAAPGDSARLTNVRLHSRFARAELAELVVPGPDRVQPPCPHYLGDQCGSCQLQHLDIAAQRLIKARIVGDIIRRIAKVEIADPCIVPAPEQFHYRAKVTFTCSGRALGYHRVDRPGQVFDVDHCLLAEPELDLVHQALKTARRLLPHDTEKVVLRRDAKGRSHLLVRTGGRTAWTDGPRMHQQMAIDVTIWWHPQGGAPRAVAGSGEPWPVTVFEQVHPAMGHRVRADAVAKALSAVPEGMLNPVIWDLYAGIGETTALLAASGAAVESVERDRRAVELAERLGPAGPRRLADDVVEAIGSLSPPVAVITNPPRTGMDAPVSVALDASGARRIIYISCDPATLARDIVRLQGGFKLVDLLAYDQFPQTAHVECIAVLDAR